MLRASSRDEGRPHAMLYAGLDLSRKRLDFHLLDRIGGNPRGHRRSGPSGPSHHGRTTASSRHSWVSLILRRLRKGRRTQQEPFPTLEGGMNGTATRQRLQLVGAFGGAIFAVLTLVAYLVHAGPSSDEGVTVVEYYSTHGTATLWAAALVGVAVIGFIWFAETFGGRTSLRAVGVAGASVTAAL